MKDDKVNGDGGIMDWGKLQKENEKLRKEVAEVGAKKDGEILIGANIILKLELQVASLTEQLAEAKKWWNKFEEGYGEALEQLAAIKENKVTALATERARGDKLLAALNEYGSHDTSCILSRWCAGRPDNKGGYETKFGDKWYSRNDLPKCTCGFDEAIAEETK